MKIEMEIGSNDKAKRRFIHYAKKITPHSVSRTKELDNFFCTNPVTALLYLCEFSAKEDFEKKKVWSTRGLCTEKRRQYGLFIKNPEENKISVDLENIFSKNTVCAINYLLLTGQKSFSNESLNKKIMKRVYVNPHYSFFYSFYVLQDRIPEDKEEVFLKDGIALYHYAKIVSNKRYNKDIEKKITLQSFENKYKDAGVLDSHGKRKSLYALKEHDYLKLYLNDFENYKEEYIHWYYIRKLRKVWL